MCSPLYCSRFGSMAYLLQAAWAICGRLCTVQLHALMPQWLPAWQIWLLMAGFRGRRPARAPCEQAVLNHSCTASIAAFDPFMRGGQNEVDELSITAVTL